MVTQSKSADFRLFRAISDQIRREILDLLRRGDRSAGDIAVQFPVSRPAVSRHLRVLRAVGLIRETRLAQTRIYALDATPLAHVEHWLAAYRVYWAERPSDQARAEVEQKREGTTNR